MFSKEGDRRIYGGWFYFAGEVAQGGERNSMLTNFEFWFADAKRLPQPPADFGDKVAAIEFLLPWVLADPPETP